MKIYREVNGVEMEFELTPVELSAAHNEMAQIHLRIAEEQYGTPRCWEDDEEIGVKSDKICSHCKGSGYVMIYGREDTPEDCPACHGTGRSPFVI